MACFCFCRDSYHQGYKARQLRESCEIRVELTSWKVFSVNNDERICLREQVLMGFGELAGDGRSQFGPHSLTLPHCAIHRCYCRRGRVRRDLSLGLLHRFWVGGKIPCAAHVVNLRVSLQAEGTGERSMPAHGKDLVDPALIPAAVMRCCSHIRRSHSRLRGNRC